MPGLLVFLEEKVAMNELYLIKKIKNLCISIFVIFYYSLLRIHII